MSKSTFYRRVRRLVARGYSLKSARFFVEQRMLREMRAK